MPGLRDAGVAGLKVAAWGMVVISVILAVVFASRFGRDPALSESPLLGKPMPAATLPRLVGEGEVDLASYRGEILVINFFASWCLECRLEHDALVAASESFAGSGVKFLGIAYQDDRLDALEFLDTEGLSPATDYLLDEGSRAAIAFGVFGIPETYFVDPDGTVVGRIIGPTDALTLGQSIDAIRRGEDPGQRVLGNTRSAPGDS
ncbi:MAG TPA: redoxin domain-containing protein [Acidimicrobiia bacterium]|nr:redoxin domain-containing protein [Acidimicrobiia bacterium]